ncbi:MAG: rhomboid family intramembrane serine protease [Bacteroidales bacterium]|nr:MAG: rhomboid family intramembrane serine protease [Bacteroidales bacterium]
MQNSEEIKKLKYSIILPLFFVLTLWIVKIVDVSEHLNLFYFGVFPRDNKGLLGIIISPLIHSDFNHLISNSIPLLVLGTGIIYFYRKLAYRVIGFVWLLSGICVWMGARPSYHIGASGLVYGLAAFLFLSGLIRKDVRLASISLLVVFLYGGLVWGVLPIFPHISWEYHLFGGTSGFMAAFLYRNKGPERIIWSWELENENTDEDNEDDLNKKTIE